MRIIIKVLLQCFLLIAISYCVSVVFADEIDKTTANWSILKAHQQILAGELDQCELETQQVLVRDPKNIDAIYIVASLYLKKGKLKEGKTITREALSVAPTDARFHQLFRAFAEEEYTNELRKCTDQYQRLNFDEALKYGINARSIEDTPQIRETLYLIYMALHREDDAKNILAIDVELRKKVDRIKQDCSERRRSRYLAK